MAKMPNSDFAPRRAGTAGATLSVEQKQRMIAEAAYFIAEKRGFSGGDPIADWLEAERKINRELGLR